jgi:hypothetical protein
MAIEPFEFMLSLSQHEIMRHDLDISHLNKLDVTGDKTGKINTN